MRFRVTRQPSRRADSVAAVVREMARCLRLRLLRAEGATELFTSHVIGEGAPDGFYDSLGFVPTGTFDPLGERILRLDLTSSSRQRPRPG